jgi:hypothetical protein
VNGELDTLAITPASLLKQRDMSLDRMIQKRIVGFVASRARVEVASGKSLQELLTINDVDLWSIIRAELYYRVRPTLYAYYLVQHVVQQRRSRSIALTTGNVITDYTHDLERCVEVIACLDRLCLTVTGRSSLRRAAQSFCSALEAKLIRQKLFKPKALRRFVSKTLRQLPRPDEEESLALGIPPRGTVVFAFEYLSELRMMAPVIDRLLQRGAHHITLCGVDDSCTLFGQPWLRQYLACRPDCRCSDPFSNAKDSTPVASPTITSQAINTLASDDGLPLEALVGDVFQQLLSHLVLETRLRQIKALGAWLDVVQPSLVVTTNPYGVKQRMVLQSCKSRGVGTLQVPHHTDQLEDVLQVSLPEADHLAVMGFENRRELLDRGIPSERIHVTGAPAFDTTASPSKSPAEGTGGRQAVVLLAAQGLPGEVRLVRTLIAVIEHCTGVRLVIRPHPNHASFLYTSVVRLTRANNTQISTEGDIHDALRSCDLLVTVNSQSAYHAVILDKPVILANLEAFPELPLLARYGAAAEATDGVILLDLVRELLAGGALSQRLAHGRRQFVEAYLGCEHASANVADLIERLATQSRAGA